MRRHPKILKKKIAEKSDADSSGEAKKSDADGGEARRSSQSGPGAQEKILKITGKSKSRSKSKRGASNRAKRRKRQGRRRQSTNTTILIAIVGLIVFVVIAWGVANAGKSSKNKIRLAGKPPTTGKKKPPKPPVKKPDLVAGTPKPLRDKIVPIPPPPSKPPLTVDDSPMVSTLTLRPEKSETEADIAKRDHYLALQNTDPDLRQYNLLATLNVEHNGKNIEVTDIEEKYYYLKLNSAVNAGTLEKLLPLGKWCLEKDLPIKAEVVYFHAYSLFQNDQKVWDGIRALGYIKIDRHWIAEEEAKTIGYFKYKGEWLHWRVLQEKGLRFHEGEWLTEQEIRDRLTQKWELIAQKKVMIPGNKYKPQLKQTPTKGSGAVADASRPKMPGGNTGIADAGQPKITGDKKNIVKATKPYIPDLQDLPPIIKTSRPGRTRRYPVPFASAICLVDANDEKILQKTISPYISRQLRQNYTDHIEQYCLQKGYLPGDMQLWLKKFSQIRETFWQALDPYYDDLPEAIRLLNILRQKYPKRVERNYHLAIAIAIVWDTSDSLFSSRYWGLWSIFQPAQFPKLLRFWEVFAYYTELRNRRWFVFNPQELSWPLLIHLVDLDISQEEITWAQQNYAGKTKNIGKLYSDVTYDQQRLETRRPSIGANDYTLSNIMKYNGVCGDQAHFMTRIAKCFAIPACKVSGFSRFNVSSGHCWAGYLIGQGGRASMEFTGRYYHDMYYTGDIFDPQTRQKTLDRFIAMTYASVSVSYRKYMESLVLARMARYLRDKDCHLTLKLTKYVLSRNCLLKAAWEMLVDCMVLGVLKKNEILPWLNLMIDKLQEHPDMTIHVLENFLDAIPKKNSSLRQQYYNKLFAVYKKRPDLQLRLRIPQCHEMAEAGQAKKAMLLALSTCQKHAQEGALILPLVEHSVAIAKKHGYQRYLRRELEKVRDKFPKYRGGEITTAYQKFGQILQSIDEK